MTLRELIGEVGEFRSFLIWFYAALPLLTGLVRVLHGKGGGAEKPWRYVYAALVYLVSIPGMFAAVLTLYLMLFVGENLLDQDLLLTFVPIGTMFVTLALMSRFVALVDLPGFDRISGLMVLLGVTFGILFLLQRLRFFVGFFGGIGSMLAIGAFLFVCLKWATRTIFRGPGEPREKPPSLRM